jgi:flagella basal body P-ring formation protein FlgA
MKMLKLTFWLLLMGFSTIAAAELQSLPEIQAAVQTFVQTSLSPEGNYQIDVTPLDAHLQLPKCDQALEVMPQSSEVKAGRNTLQVSCKGSQTWKIYTTASVKSYKEVLVLTRPLRRNDIIHAEDVAHENREVGSLSQGYIVNPDDVINKQAARNLQLGTVLNAQSYQDLIVVKRGDHVNIQVGKAGVSISMAGIAMMNGAIGEKINVKNISSQKMVQAVVVNPSQVSVIF